MHGRLSSVTIPAGLAQIIIIVVAYHPADEAAGTWDTVRIEGLPKSVDGVSVTYYVVETDPAKTDAIYVRYTTEIGGQTVESTDPTVTAGQGELITITNQDISVDINILKVDPTDEDKKLPGAIFRLQKCVGTDPDGKDIYSNYNIKEKRVVQDGDNANCCLRITDGNGSLTFGSLQDGKYRIQEAQAPDGYVKLHDNDIYFTITNDKVYWKDEQGNTLIGDSRPDDIEYDDVNTFQVDNTPGSSLPNAGGPGTVPGTIFGSILALVAGALLMKRWRRFAKG